MSVEEQPLSPPFKRDAFHSGSCCCASDDAGSTGFCALLRYDVKYWAGTQTMKSKSWLLRRPTNLCLLLRSARSTHSGRSLALGRYVLWLCDPEGLQTMILVSACTDRTFSKALMPLAHLTQAGGKAANDNSGLRWAAGLGTHPCRQPGSVHAPRTTHASDRSQRSKSTFGSDALRR
jgi:hypothetical protein